MPKVSIIIPVYNKEKVLDRSLASVVNQTFTDFEVIVINDESEDNSLAVCRKWAECDSRIKVYDKKNSGIAAARNFGLVHATGEWIGFVDSDDWVEPDWLEKILSYQEYDLLIWGYHKDTYSSSGTTPKNEIITFSKPDFILMKDNPKQVIEYDTKLLYPLWNKLFRRNVIEHNHLSFPPISCWEDACFVCDYLRYTQSVVSLTGSFYHYNVVEDEQSLSKQRYTPDRYKQYLTLYGHFKALCDAYGNCDAALKKNDLRLAFNAAGDLLYNNNAHNNGLSRKEKLRYIHKVRNADAIKSVLCSINSEEISLKDIQLCFEMMRKSDIGTYYICLLLNQIRRIKKKLLG